MIDNTRAWRTLLVTAVMVAGLIVSSAHGALAQTLTAPTFSNASSGNELGNGFFDNPTYERESDTQTISSSATSFQTRYFGLASADCGLFCGGRSETLSSNYTVSWNATAPNIYQLVISTRRTAGLTIVDEGDNGSATMGSLSCAPSGGTVVSGACTLADPADNTSGGTSDVNVNQTNTLTLCRQSLAVAQAHSINFTWSQSANTPSTSFSNGDEAAVRLGGTSDDGSETAADYPGVGSRSQPNDGHFVTVTITNLCGNGVINTCGSAQEDCDEGALNGTATSCCTNRCQFKAAGAGCRGNAGACDTPEFCTGSSGSCPADTFLPMGTVCRSGSPGDVCDQTEVCTGTGAACPADQVKPAGTLCRASAGTCDVQENCDGVNKKCPPDVKSTAECRAAADTCDLAESCDGVNNDCPADAFKPFGTQCRVANGECDVADTCLGFQAACPADAKRFPGFPCTSDGLPCTLDQCNGTSNLCQHPAGNPGTQCRAAAGVCDIAETCDGISTACPGDAVRPNGTSCTSDGNPCTVDACDGVDTACQHPAGNAGAVCRADAGACDVAELCDGTSTCPPNSFEPPGTACTTDFEACTVDECDGSGTCTHPAGNAGVTCRAASAGETCDANEQCDGTTPSCPPDAVQPNGTTCRASAGVCDVAETCNGSSKFCPANAFVSSSTQCRASAGVCDPAENCTGSGPNCPANAFSPSSTQCRAAAGGCDLAENCTGSSAACPANALKPNGAVCRAAAGSCDVAEQCDGVTTACPADGFAPSTTQCRAAAGVCDMAENCTGSGPTCPVDGFQPNGTDCSDSLFCNGAETCQSGACANGPPACSGMQSCDEATNACFTGQCPTNAVACRTAMKSILVIKDKTDNSKDKLIWKWLKGANTLPSEFADPINTATYALCFYDGPSASLIGSAVVPPSNTKWKAIGAKGYKYKDPAGTEDGIQKIVLKGSLSNKSKALVKGKGAGLPDFTLPFPSGDLPVIVQLRNNSNGVCWEGSFATPIKNQPGAFKGKSP